MDQQGRDAEFCGGPRGWRGGRQWVVVVVVVSDLSNSLSVFPPSLSLSPRSSPLSCFSLSLSLS